MQANWKKNLLNASSRANEDQEKIFLDLVGQAFNKCTLEVARTLMKIFTAKPNYGTQERTYFLVCLICALCFLQPDANAVGLDEVLEHISTTVHVELPLSNLGDVGVTRLASRLPSSMVRRLELNGNHIGDEGAEALAAALKAHRIITSIELSDNNIGDRGAKALARAFRELPSLTSVYLVNNRIGIEGARALGELRFRIDLSGNLIDNRFKTTLMEDTLLHFSEEQSVE